MASTIPDRGQDNRIEWQLQQNWPTSAKTIDMAHSLDGKFVFILNDQQQVQIFNKQGQLQGNIPVGGGVSAIDIAPRGETLYLVDTDKQTFSSVAVSYVVNVDITGSPFKGYADAPVVISVFSDFEWPYCGKILPLLEQVLEKNPQTVKLVFKNMPLGMHKLAEPAARAALAAQEQGKFWEFHDSLFALKKLNNVVIKKIANDLQLDIPLFEKDMASAKIQTKLRKDLFDAQKAGVTGTPAIFINGRKLSQRTIQGFQAIIDEELKKLEKNN